jgi:hypothetical protein
VTELGRDTPDRVSGGVGGGDVAECLLVEYPGLPLVTSPCRTPKMSLKHYKRLLKPDEVK